MKPLIIFGAGGHAKVIADLALQAGYEIRGFLDDHPSGSSCLGFPILGRIEDCLNYKNTDFALGIGNNAIRKRIMEQFDLHFPPLIHPRATVSQFSTVGAGTVVMAGAIINACAAIGQGCVVNTAAVIEHDCTIGDFTLLAPHSTVCGVTAIGSECWIGAGSTVNNGLQICDNVTVGSGASVVRNITQAGTYVGVPAKKLNGE